MTVASDISAVATEATQANRPPVAARVRSLDILRGIAVLLVLGRHFSTWPADLPAPLIAGLTAWKQVGWCGVDLFFVLSGFLVSGLLFREYQTHGQVDVVRFMVRRGFKIYPSFYVMLVVSLLAFRLFHDPIPPQAVLSEVLFLQSYIPRLWNHTWTLAVEEHFYLLLGGIVWWLSRNSSSTDSNPFRRLLPIFLGLACVVESIRIWNALTVSYTHQTHLIPTHLRIDSLFLGVVVSYLWHFHKSAIEPVVREGRAGWLLAVALLASPVAFFPLGEGVFLHSIGFGLLSLAAGLLVLTTLDWSLVIPGCGPITSLLSLIGVHSYSIYLWHMPVQRFLPRLLRRIGPRVGLDLDFGYVTTVGLYLVVSVIVGVVMSKLIDFPCLAWRDRLFPSRARALA